MDVRYTHVITRFFPQSQHYSVGPRYEDIVWITQPLAKEVLDEKMLDVAKDMRAEVVRQESIYVRAVATKIVVGTDDLLMLRTYDEKQKEAEQFLIDGDVSKCNLLRQEAGQTGVDLEVLANAVLDQYRLSSEILNPVLGAIEAVRRNKINDIYLAVSLDSLEDVADPVWPDLLGLQPI